MSPARGRLLRIALCVSVSFDDFLALLASRTSKRICNSSERSPKAASKHPERIRGISGLCFVWISFRRDNSVKNQSPLEIIAHRV